MGLLKFIFYFILVLWALRILFRLLLPVIFKRLVIKMQNQAQQTNPGRSNRKEGSINVDFVPPKSKTAKAEKAGEFVDFEEIK